MRRQLALLSAATSGLVLVAFLIPIGLLLRGQAEQRAISVATLDAHSRVAVVSLDPEGAAARVTSGTTVTVFMADGQVFGRTVPRTDSVELAALGRAFTAWADGGLEVLVPVNGLPEGTAVIRVYVTPDRLHEGVMATWLVLLGIGLVLFLVSLVLADLLGRHLVGAAASLGRTADRLARGDLEARLEPAGPPELRRAGAELNHLAARITELLANQRREAADLAHRLRTPLAALRLDAGSLRIAEERIRITQDADEVGQMVDEVINAARRPVREAAGTGSDLVAVAAERVAFWSALADDTGRPLERYLPEEPLFVRVSAGDLAAVVDVLLENAFTYSPEIATVRVAVTPLPSGGGRLLVEDAGPGFPPDTGSPSGAEPGWRTGTAAPAGEDDRRRTGSTGLGLDIVRRTATASHGSLTLDCGPLGGARVRVDFGPPLNRSC